MFRLNLQFKSKSDKGLTDRSLENEKAKRVEAESLAKQRSTNKVLNSLLVLYLPVRTSAAYGRTRM